jgi:hypothetical protein
MTYIITAVIEPIYLISDDRFINVIPDENNLILKRE